MRSLVLLLILLLGITPCAQAGDSIMDREYELKAVYLWHLGKYVKWPNDTSENFAICVLGERRILPELHKLSKVKKVLGKSIVVHYFETVKLDHPCQIWFIGKSSISSLNNDDALVVSESAGSDLRLRVDSNENRIKLELRKDALVSRGFSIRAKFLALTKSGILRIVP